MPDLGKYATEVLLAYGVSIAFLVGLVVLSWRQSRAAKRRLIVIEERSNG
jgi:heme exporter protein D